MASLWEDFYEDDKVIVLKRITGNTYKVTSKENGMVVFVEGKPLDDWSSVVTIPEDQE